MYSDTQTLPPEMLSGHTSVIAGGTGHVGRVLVEAFLEAGATVVVPSRSADKIAGLREALSPRDLSQLITIEGNLGDETDGARVRSEIVERAGSIDDVIASLGGFVPAPSVLEAPLGDLEHALDGYLIGHFLVAKALMPAIKEGGTYTFINGPLAFDPLFPGSGLISIATAAQAMLARVVMKEMEGRSRRVNEIVLYTSFGWGDDQRGNGPVSQRDVGRYAAYLASSLGSDTRGESIHMNSLEPFEALLEVQ